METLIPQYQPIAFPAPLWLLQLLLVLGFFLHVIPMNISLVGGLFSWLFIKLGKNDDSSYFTRTGQTLAGSLPVFLSFAITQGIVPLLFLQLIYGPLYYSSSILMGVPWLSVIFILLVAYYLLYIYKIRRDKMGKINPIILVIASLMFFVIAAIFTSNMTLMLDPEKWQTMLDQTGLHFHWDWGLVPRYLHFTVSAFAITGLAIAAYGIYFYKKEQVYGKWLIQTGSTWYVAVTLLQLFIGSWFLMSLGREQMLLYMGQDSLGTAAFALSILFMVISLMTGFWAMSKGSVLAYWLTAITASLTVLGMVVMRHVLRHFATIDFINPALVDVKMQWDLFIAFAILALGLIIYLIWLSRLIWSAYQNPEEAV